MAQSGYTPILHYGSSGVGSTPLAANLTSNTNGVELAVNYADGKLFYKDSGGVVQVLATKAGAFGTVTSVAATVPSFLSISGSPITSSGTLAITLSGTALPTTNGGTGLTSFTANGVLYASSSSALTTGSALTFDGTNFGTAGTSSGSRIIATSTLADGSTPHLDTSASAFGIVGGSSSMGYKATSQHIWNLNGTSEQMRLTSTGLGIGTSSPAYKLDVNGVGRAQSRFIVGPANDSSDRMFYVSGTAPTSGSSQFGAVINPTLPNTVSSAAYGFYTNLNIASGATVTNAFGLYVDALSAGSSTITNKYGLYVADTNNSYIGGNLGLAVTPSAWNSNYKALQVKGASLFQGAATSEASLSANNYVDSVGDKYIATNFASCYTQYNGQHIWKTAPSGTAGNAITFTQAMTLDANGRLIIGNTAIIGPGKINTYFNGSTEDGIDFKNTNTGNTGAFVAFFNSAGGVAGSITQSSATTVLYNVTSDYRLKENIVDAASASALIDAIQVRQYNWKSDGSHQRYGFIAQELVAVAPEAVHQPANPEEMMAVDYSKLVPMLVKEIQSLRKRLAALEVK